MKNWIIFGLIWGVITALVRTLLIPYIEGRTLSWREYLIKIIISLVVGLILGYALERWNLIKSKDTPTEE
jgi:high-affinity Fe2+/Pb2+ permease